MGKCPKKCGKAQGGGRRSSINCKSDSESQKPTLECGATGGVKKVVGAIIPPATARAGTAQARQTLPWFVKDVI
jgi:hypothetical protein